MRTDDDMQYRIRDADRRSTLQLAGLVIGLIVLIVPICLPTVTSFVTHTARSMDLPADHPDVVEVARGCQMTLTVLLLMVIWWVTEAAPLPVTALLPGILLPMLHVTGVRDGGLYAFGAKAAFASFANPVIYLFLAGFLLAAGMRKSGLDRRITLSVLSMRAIMRGPGAILLAVMAICAILSMWISNTATCAMMLPIAVAILAEFGETPGQSRFATALLLGVAWSCSIGGLGTLIGTPPNGIVQGILAEQGIADIDFLDWMKIGMPVAIVGVLAAWLVLYVIYRPRLDVALHKDDALSAMRASKRRLGRMGADEIATTIVFALVVLMWITHPFWEQLLPSNVYQRVERLGIHEIGLLGAVLLFLIPVDRQTLKPVLRWADARYVDWGTLLLFGGGIAISSAMFTTGLTEWIASGFVGWIGRPEPWISLALVVLLVDFLTEVTSNTAVTTMMTPVLATLAPELGLSPVVLCVAAAMAASLAFMLPVATPPNAIVFSSGYFSVGQMARAGFLMNLVGCLVLLTSLYFLSSSLLHLSSI